MPARLWRIPGLIILWNLTVAAPSCDGSHEEIPPPLCGEAPCTSLQFCREAVCVPLLEAGAECERRQCAATLRCDTGMVSPVCVAPGEVSPGGECRVREDCADGLVCYPNRLCEAPLGEGDDCDRSPSICAAELRCHIQSNGPDLCLPPAREGDACTRHDSCEDGLICSFGVGDKTCIPPRAPGEHCQIHPDCAEGLYCVDYGEADAQCAWAGEQGDPCNPDALELCQARLVCDDGACRLAQEGELCWNDDDCRADLECPYNADGSVCAPRPAE